MDPRRGITGWDPLRSFRDLLQWDPLSQLELMPRAEAPAFVPDVDVRETPQQYVLKADLPGLREEDVEISVTGNRVAITGRRQEEQAGDADRYFLCERPSGTFSRSFVLPEDSDPENIRAEMRNGVLSLIIAKRPEVQPRRIQLGGHGGGRAQPGDGGAAAAGSSGAAAAAASGRAQSGESGSATAGQGKGKS